MRPGLDEGEASRSREAAALLVLLKQLLQSLHVQCVIVVHLLLGCGHWGTWMGRPTAETGGQVREGPGLHAQLIVAFFPCTWALTHSGDGSGVRGSRPQDLAEKRPRPQKMYDRSSGAS